MTLAEIAEIADILVAWTPYLLGGFGWNMVISLAAMVIGTAAGLLLALMRNSGLWGIDNGGRALTVMLHAAPTFVMLFYLTYLIPEQIGIFGLILQVPIWIKASLAFGIAVTGFVSDNALVALRHLARNQVSEALLFLPSWTNYFLIIVMASSTASVVGVPELVYRARVVIGAVDQAGFAVWAYLYAMIWFALFGAVATAVMRVLRTRLTRISRTPPSTPPDKTA